MEQIYQLTSVKMHVKGKKTANILANLSYKDSVSVDSGHIWGKVKSKEGEGSDWERNED